MRNAAKNRGSRATPASQNGRSSSSNGELVMPMPRTFAKAITRSMWSAGFCPANHCRSALSSPCFGERPKAFRTVKTPRHASETGEWRTNKASQMRSACSVLVALQKRSSGTSDRRNDSLTR